MVNEPSAGARPSIAQQGPGWGDFDAQVRLLGLEGPMARWQRDIYRKDALTFHVGGPIEHLKEMLVEEGRTLSPLFDPSESDVRRDQIWWGYANDAHGRMQHYQLARLDSTGTSGSSATADLADLCVKIFEPHYPSAHGLSLPRHVQQVRGDVVYRGGFWIGQNVRNRWKMFEPLGLIGLVHCFLTWQCPPAFVWAVFEQKPATLGLPIRTWFETCTPIGRAFEDWLKADEMIATVSFEGFMRRVALLNQEMARSPANEDA